MHILLLLLRGLLGNVLRILWALANAAKDERDSAEGDGVVKKAGHNGLEGGGQSGPKKTLEGVKRVAASDRSKERGLPAPSPVRSSPEEIVAPEVSKEVSPFPLVVSGVEVIDSEEGSEEEETSDEESSESQGNAASSFRDSSKTCLFVPESDCVIDAHFGIGLDFVDVGKLDDSAPCSESVLVVGSDSKGSSGSQTGAGWGFILGQYCCFKGGSKATYSKA
ncbi:hypothetical protein U1Q18_040582 [Sarracenia purpurea var. burkii]